jgi:hypothetical protein
MVRNRSYFSSQTHQAKMMKEQTNNHPISSRCLVLVFTWLSSSFVDIVFSRSSLWKWLFNHMGKNGDTTTTLHFVCGTIRRNIMAMKLLAVCCISTNQKGFGSFSCFTYFMRRETMVVRWIQPTTRCTSFPLDACHDRPQSRRQLFCQWVFKDNTTVGSNSNEH